MNFKKHMGVFLTALLLVSNLGLAFKIHYCGDKIDSVTINSAPTIGETFDECCGIIETDSQCCNDKVIKAEIKSDHVITNSVSIDFNYIPINYDWNVQFFASTYNFKQRDTSTYYCDANAPPLYLLYSQYTFYA